MESTRRDPGVPKGKEGEKGITRRLRLRGAPKEGRLLGVRRLPRSLAGGVLMMGVLVWFFAGLSGRPLNFLIGFSIIVGVLGLAIWALSMTPIRAKFDQRWKPKRRIEALDTTGWATVAAEFGARLRPGRLPRIDGRVDGIPFRLAFFQRGGARTVAVAKAARSLPKPVRAFPRRAEFRTKHDVRIGDRDFDRAWHVQSADPDSAKRLLSPEARLWIDLAAPESIEAKRRNVVVRRKSFTDEVERLRALVRTALELARPSG
ncbi:MAG: hypothetical protein ABFS86_18220 [Planctomycetota bacterium]